MSQEFVILPSTVQTDWWRKRAAAASQAGLFAQDVSTFEHWVADLWELHGDGRALVNAVQREMLMRIAAQEGADEADAEGAVPVLSLASVAAECVRLASGLPAFEEVLATLRAGPNVEQLSPQEQNFARIIARYEDLLADHDLIEFGSATAELARRSASVFPNGARVRMPLPGLLTWIEENFFSSCIELELVLSEGDSGAAAEEVTCVPSGVDLCFACPSGELAQPALIADIVRDCAPDASVVITCTDPLGMFERLDGKLGQNRRLVVQASKAFKQTDFGQAFSACMTCLNDEPGNLSLLSDLVFGPFSGISRKRAVELDARLRGDRLMGCGQAIQELTGESTWLAQLFELAKDNASDETLDDFEQRVRAMSDYSSAWCAEQLAAIKMLREVRSVARAAGVGIDACADVFECHSVNMSVASGSGALTLITSQNLAAQLEPGSFGAAIVADLTSSHYPIADRDDAATTFFSKLGFEPCELPMEKARRDFEAVLALARHSLVLARPLGDADAKETHPAAVLEELIDSYRSDPSNTEELKNAYRLPKSLRKNLAQRGEELLFANACADESQAQQQAVAEVEWPDMAQLKPQDVPSVVLPRKDSSGHELAHVCLSPSQIETYLTCPYLWFAQRRLHLDTVEEGFGSLERGSFVHEVLEKFYRKFQDLGHQKVTEANLGEARALMKDVFERAAREQYGYEPGERYVAATELERWEVAGLCKQLIAYLDFEAQLLPSFHPKYFEYEIEADNPAAYADYLIVGKIDRIDVDDEGHAVIIDYKGSLKNGFEIAGKDANSPGKVQARIYAQVVKRVLGLDVVGALYVSYGAHPSVSGAYDPRVLSTAHLPGIREDKCACGALEEVPDPLPADYSLASLSFEAMLDETENLVGGAIASMVAGDIAPNPTDSHACEYCPVLECSKRGA